MDEAFGGLHANKADGTSLPGFPVIADIHEEEVHTPAIADLDGDGTLEIVTATGLDADRVSVYAFHRDGTLVTDFPVKMPVARVDTFPVIGDADGDGSPEILAGAFSEVYVWSSVGALKRKIPITGTLAYGIAPALADLDADGLPEIIVVTDGCLNAWNGDGSAVTGFPVYFGSGYSVGHSAPVVGDVDGDNQPDIVFTLNMAGDYEMGWVRLYNRHGVLHPHFPKQLYIGQGAVPAIADIDLDGHNEIIATGNPGYYGGYADKVWVFDLGGPKHGGIEWGQFGGGPRHQSYYPPKQRHFLPMIAR